MKYIDKILNELSFRVSDGMPDFTNEQHLIKLYDILNDLNWDEEVINELLYNLSEDEDKVPNPNPKTKERYPMVTPATAAKYLGKQQDGAEEDGITTTKKKKTIKKKKKKKTEPDSKRTGAERKDKIDKDKAIINAIKDPVKRFQEMKKLTNHRRKEIYEGKDLPAGKAGSTTGEMGGGIAAEDIGDPDDPNISEEEWIEQELKAINDAEGEETLKDKLCEDKSPKDCEAAIKEWLGVAYRTGLNELNALKTNPKYNAEWPQPEPYPSGHIMDFHGKAMVKNELEKKSEESNEKYQACIKTPEGEREENGFAGTPYDCSIEKSVVEHYDKQLRRVGVPPGNPDELEESDTGILYLMKNGELGFKHTSNKKSLGDTHNNKTISSKIKSMTEAAQRQKDRKPPIFDSTDIDEITGVVSKEMDESIAIVEIADRQAQADAGKVDESALVSGAGSLMKKLPGQASTKGTNYAEKVRKAKDGTASVRKELKRLKIDVKTASDAEILQATLNVLKNGNFPSKKAEKEVIAKREELKKKIAELEEKEELTPEEEAQLGEAKEALEAPIQSGNDSSGNPLYYKAVIIEGKEEIRQCDSEGNPASPVFVGKMVYKISQLIKKTRTKAAKVDPPLTEDSTDKELEEFGKFYDPNLTADEVRWMLFSEEADALENTNDDRKSGMDRAHAKVVKACNDEDQKWFAKNPDKAKEMGWRQREDGTWESDPDKPTKNGPATQQYVDSYMEDMHWNRYIDGDHDGVGDMSINGQNVDPADFRTCLSKLSGHLKKEEDETDEDYAARCEEHYKDPANREAFKQHLREQTRISAEVETDGESDDTGRVTKESKEAHISFDTEVPAKLRGRETGRMRKVSVGEETYRSKGVGVNSVLGGLGVDMQTCLQGEMNRKNVGEDF